MDSPKLALWIETDFQTAEDRYRDDDEVCGSAPKKEIELSIDQSTPGRGAKAGAATALAAVGSDPLAAVARAFPARISPQIGGAGVTTA